MREQISEQARRVMLGTSILALGACGGNDAGTGPDTPVLPAGVRAVTGAGVTDTVSAMLPQALIVEVRGVDGKPAVGVTVRFEPVAPADTTRRNERAVLVCGLSAPTCDGSSTSAGLFASQVTDTAGRAKTVVRLGTVAGRAVVRLTVPELGLADSATYTVTAGAPARVRFTVRDTALRTGASASLGPALRDRYGNSRPETLSFSTTAGVEVAATGVATARAIGRAPVVARYQTLVDTAFVSVVPVGTFAAYTPNGSPNDATVFASFDGLDVKKPAANTGSSIGSWPSWGPGGTRVVFHAGYNSPRLYITDEVGPPRRVTADTLAETYPSWSVDGEWIYYTRSVFAGYYAENRIWRVHPDGTGAEAVGGLSGSHPTASPDGRRVLFTSSDGTLAVHDLAQRSTTSLGLYGTGARWSPDGTRIAMVSGSIVVMRADGSDRRTLSQPGENYLPGLSWSPDGAWLLARLDYAFPPAAPYTPSQLRLVNVATGGVVPLRIGQSWVQPTWRP